MNEIHLRTRTLLRVGAATLLTLALAACSRGGGGDGDGSGEPGALAQAVDRVASAAADLTGRPGATAREPVVAAMPDDLLRVLPPGPTLVATLDVDAAFRVAASFSGGTSDEEVEEAREQLGATLASLVDEEFPELDFSAMSSAILAVYPAGDDADGLIVTQAGAYPGAPADGAPPMPVEDGDETVVAVRGGILLVGQAPVVERAIALDDGAPRFAPADAWPEGWAVASDRPIFSLFVADVAAASDALGNDLDGMQDAGIRRFAMSARAAGGLQAALDVEDAAAVTGPLAQAQSAYDRMMMQVRPIAPPVAQGWVRYLDLIHRAAWSQLQIERSGTVTTLELPDPACGTPFGYALLAAVYAGAVDAAPPANGPAPTLETYDQAVADTCGSIEGPAPSLPVEWTKLVTDPAADEQMLVLADVGALLRANLPTFFGLLPFALPHDDVREAMGANPLGLSGLDDADGDVAFLFGNEPGGRDQVTGVLPNGLFGLLPIPPSPDMVNTRVEGAGYVVGTTGADQRVAGTRDASSSWSVLADGLPADSAFVMLIPGDAVRELMTEFDTEIAGLDQVTVGALSLSDTLSLSVHLHTTGDSEALATGLRDAVAAFITEAAENAGGDAPALAPGRLTDGLVFGGSGPIASVEMEHDVNLGPWAALGGIFAAAMPAMLGPGVGDDVGFDAVEAPAADAMLDDKPPKR